MHQSTQTDPIDTAELCDGSCLQVKYNDTISTNEAKLNNKTNSETIAETNDSENDISNDKINYKNDRKDSKELIDSELIGANNEIDLKWYREWL